MLALLLLLGQQGGAMHALRHAFAEQTQQQQKQTSHPNDCERCISYAQLGGAVNSSYLFPGLLTSLTQALAQLHFVCFTSHSIPATARGPPSNQRTT